MRFDCRVTMLVRKKTTTLFHPGAVESVFFHATSTAAFSDSVLQKVHIPFPALVEFRVAAC